MKCSSGYLETLPLHTRNSALVQDLVNDVLEIKVDKKEFYQVDDFDASAPLSDLPKDWVNVPEINVRLVDDLSYVPREKIIERALKSGEMYDLFIQSGAYQKMFDITDDDKLTVEDEVLYMSRDELADAYVQNSRRIEELQANAMKMASANAVGSGTSEGQESEAHATAPNEAGAGESENA